MKRLLSIAALAAAWAGAPAQAAVVLSFSPSSSQIAVGDSATVAVSISGLGAEVLSALDINLVFGSPVSLAGVDFAGLLGALGAGADLLVDTNNPLSELGLQANAVLDDAALAGQQADSFLLGTLLFTGLADGATILTLGPDADFQRNFVGLDAQTLEVRVGSACIAVGTGSCAVPEPASWGLAGVALLTAGLAGRRRRPAA